MVLQAVWPGAKRDRINQQTLSRPGGGQCPPYKKLKRLMKEPTTAINSKPNIPGVRIS